MSAILIGASHDTPNSGFVPLSSGQFEFVCEGLNDSHFILEGTGQKVGNGVKFTLDKQTDIQLIRIKEGTERFCINVSVKRVTDGTITTEH